MNVDAQVQQGMTMSQEILNATSTTFCIKDREGRVISFRDYTAREKSKFIQDLGGNEVNDREFNDFFPLLYLKGIDDFYVTPPCSKNEAIALQTRLDKHGLEALIHGVQSEILNKIKPFESVAYIKK